MRGQVAGAHDIPDRLGIASGEEPESAGINRQQDHALRVVESLG